MPVVGPDVLGRGGRPTAVEQRHLDQPPRAEARVWIAFCTPSVAPVLGAVSLSYAAGLLSGWVQAPAPDRTRANPGPDASSWLGRQLANLSPRRAG